MPLLGLIEEIYRTGSETHDWPALVGQVAEYIGVQSGMVGITDFNTGCAEPIIHPHGLDIDPLYDIWVGEFGFANPWTAGIGPLVQGQITTGTETVPLHDFRSHSLYSDVFSPLDIDDTLVAALSTQGPRVLLLAVYCDRAHGPFGQKDRDRLRPLVPHLVRAASLETMILESGIREQMNRAALDEIEFAIYSIKALEAQPLNRRAEELVASGDGLVSRSNRLRATDDASNEALQKYLFAAGAGLRLPSVSTATPFPLRRSAEAPTGSRSHAGRSPPRIDRRRAWQHSLPPAAHCSLWATPSADPSRPAKRSRDSLI